LVNSAMREAGKKSRNFNSRKGRHQRPVEASEEKRKGEKRDAARKKKKQDFQREDLRMSFDG